MAKPLNIVVCGSLVPDPLQTLEPVQTPQGPGLKNEQMLPSVLDPWAACALYEAAALAKTRPGSKVTLVALGPKAKLQQLMMTVAQKVPLELVAVNAPAGGFTDAKDTAAELAKAIKAMPPVPTLAACAFMSAGITPRMFIMPTCGLFGGSGRLPVAQPIAAGSPAHVEERYLPPSMRSFTVNVSSSATFSSSTALKNSVIPSSSATN